MCERMRQSAPVAIRAVLGLWLLAAALPVFAGTQVLLLSGQTVPDSSGEYAYFQAPVLNNAGQVALVTQIDPTGPGSLIDGVIQTDGSTHTLIARTGMMADNVDADFGYGFEQPSQSNAGHVAFFADVVDDVTGTQEALYRGGTGGLIELARIGDAPASWGRTMQLFGGNDGAPTLNDAGQVGFLARDTAGNFDAMFIGDAGGVTLLAKVDYTVDSDVSTRTISSFIGSGSGITQAPALNNAGQAGLAVWWRAGGSTYRHRLYREEPGTGSLNMALDGGHNAIANNLYLRLEANGTGRGAGVAMNEAGQMVVASSLVGAPISERIIRTTPDPLGLSLDTQDIIVYTGQDAPDTTGGDAREFLVATESAFAINDSGNVLFFSRMRDQATQLIQTYGLFLGDGATITPVALSGQTVAGGGAMASSDFVSWVDNAPTLALNNADQVAFATMLDTTGNGIGDTRALFLWDPDDGLVEVTRQGAGLLGSTVSQFLFSGGTNERGTERSGFNDDGEVAFSFQLADGRKGVALWSFMAPLVGDLNGDGFVGQDDLNIVLGAWGTNVTPGDPLAGDPSGDGFVGQDDLNDVLAGWGQGTPPSLTVVPEPGSIVVLALAGLAVWRRR